MIARDSEQLGVGVDPPGGRQLLLRAPWALQTVHWGQDEGAEMSRSIQMWGARACRYGGEGVPMQVPQVCVTPRKPRKPAACFMWPLPAAAFRRGACPALQSGHNFPRVMT